MHHVPLSAYLLPKLRREEGEQNKRKERRTRKERKKKTMEVPWR